MIHLLIFQWYSIANRQNAHKNTGSPDRITVDSVGRRAHPDRGRPDLLALGCRLAGAAGVGWGLGGDDLTRAWNLVHCADLCICSRMHSDLPNFRNYCMSLSACQDGGQFPQLRRESSTRSGRTCGTVHDGLIPIEIPLPE
jgi:hypothetical protein